MVVYFPIHGTNLAITQNFTIYYLKNDCTNTRRVCTHLNAYDMMILKVVMTINNFKFLDKKVQFLLACRLRPLPVPGKG